MTAAANDRRLNAHRNLVLAIRARTPELSQALDWIEVTDPALDPADAARAVTHAEAVLAEHYQPDGDMPLDVYRDYGDAAAQGAFESRAVTQDDA